jgi:hypothetical protein
MLAYVQEKETFTFGIYKDKADTIMQQAMVWCISKASSKRCILHAPNAFKTMDNEAFQLIIYCFECIRHM